MNLPWLDCNVNQFTSLVQTQRIPHAILISASVGMGKFELAKKMAHVAMCENVKTTGACNQCSACVLFAAGNHIDLSVIKAENSIIKVNQIRKLTNDVVLTSTKNQFKVIIIEDAEKMNLSSSNALLKTLEEPPQKVLIILTTSEIGRLLPTIKSRCVKMTIKPIPQEMASKWLHAELNASIEDVDIAQFLTNNSVLLAKSILSNNVIDEIKIMLNDMKGLKSNSVTLLDVTKRWYANNWHLNLNYITVVLLNHIYSSYQLIVQKKNVIALDYQLNETNLLAFVNRVNLFNKRQNLPLKTELHLEQLLLLWKNT